MARRRLLPWLLASTVLSLSLVPMDRAAIDRARRLSSLPNTVLWAWERPENLRDIAPGSAVAFLAQTIKIAEGPPVVEPRRQSLYVAESTPLIAVTRIESPRPKRSRLADEDLRRIVNRIIQSSRLPGVSAVQIDFDATDSQRELYLSLLHEVRTSLDARMPLSMTALTSWCARDRWLDRAEVDEIVPMLFRMGPDTRELRAAAISTEMLDSRCRHAVGTSLDEPLTVVRHRRRVYAFSPRPWTRMDVGTLEIVDR